MDFTSTTTGDRCSREFNERMPEGVRPPLKEAEEGMMLCPECGGERDPRCNECEGEGQIDPYRDVPIVGATVDMVALKRMAEGIE